MIPVYEPLIEKEELENAVDTIKRGMISGTIGGDYNGKLEKLVCNLVGVKHGILTTSGTTALALAVASAGIGPGDEVIVPASTNIATAFAAVYVGAKPIFVDSEKETWNLDVTHLRNLITDKTRAIMPVHLFGHPADMDPIMEIAKEFNLIVIEDAAEAMGARYKDRQVGGIGQIGCFSFFINKIITTGEGGMVVTSDEGIAENARLLKNLAYSKKDKFIHDYLGYNFRFTNLQASIGVAQFEKLDKILAKKRQIALWYTERLRNIPGLTLPIEKSWAHNVYWVYAIVLGDDLPSKEEVRSRLLEMGVDTRNFFYPLNRQPVFVDMGISGIESLPVADWIWNRGLYLPSGPTLNEKDVDKVCQCLRKAIRNT